jgi:uncharacterized protein (DUF885 family)
MKVCPLLCFGVALSLALPAGAQIKLSQPPTSPTTATGKPADPLSSVPKLAGLVGRPASELADVVERFQADQTSLNRRYDASGSPEQRARLRDFYADWKTRLAEIDFDKLGQEGRVDYVLLDNYLTHQQALQALQEKRRTETLALLPFADKLLGLHDQRRDMLPIDPQAAAKTLTVVTRQIDSLRALFEPAGGRGGGGAIATGNASGPSANAMSDTTRPRAAAPKVSKTVGNRAADNADALRGVMTTWYRYYDGFDPLFTWWMKVPYAMINEAVTAYGRTLRERVVGFRPAQLASAGRGGAPAGGAGGGRGGDNGGGRGGMSAQSDEPIIGDPIGAEGLKADLAYEMIPYTPEELIAIAEKEYAFSLSEAKKAAREMGFGDDWKAAMEKVKDTYVEPGKQTELIRDLARQAENFFDQHDWVTIPPLAREDWRMDMLSPERQRVSPFFLGGEQILVSYPTADMSDEDKLMSMRGNNPHFSHATVFHELNPGHHLQGFMTARYNQQRRMFSTPFWSEGQSLYWEMFLWDHGFQQTPEDRMGALFWRMHRSARIIFSLNFHLGKMTPQQAIQFLVDTVDFERANAEGEVRRSFNGSYSPLYQAGYMLGGLQLRALHKELVDSKKMTEREFHDAVLQGGPMPITMVRARLAKIPLTRSGSAPWRFADELPPPIPFPTRR